MGYLSLDDERNKANPNLRPGSRLARPPVVVVGGSVEGSPAAELHRGSRSFLLFAAQDTLEQLSSLFADLVA